MVLTANQINKSYNAIKDISALKLNFKTAYQIHQMKKEFTEKISFLVDEEKKIISSYKGEYQEDGTVKFENETLAQDCVKEMNELRASTLELDINPVTLCLDSLGDDCSITPDEIEGLEGIIIFE